MTNFNTFFSLIAYAITISGREPYLQIMKKLYVKMSKMKYFEKDFEWDEAETSTTRKFSILIWSAGALFI